jgi:DUF4097 and DUF4098 domain-containing protein YvlB
MDERSSNLGIWIIVAAVVAIAVCCCALVAAALAGSFLWVTPMQGDEAGGKRSWQRYEVGQAPALEVDNFSGSIIVRAGEAGALEVTAYKQARRKGDLDRIEIDIKKTDGGLAIKTRKPPGVSRASVQFEIKAPADTRVDARTGAGSVRVEGLAQVRVHSGSGTVLVSDVLGAVKADTGSGSIEVRGVRGPVTVESGSGGLRLYAIEGPVDAQTGSGTVELLGASGPVILESGSGGIRYEGSPQGECRFQTGSGSISLALPSDLDMAVDLHTGSGRITVDYDVTSRGTVGRTEVTGAIGSGEDGSIWARTGSGSIRLAPQP